MRNDDLLAALAGNIGIFFAFVGSIKNDKIIRKKTVGSFSVYDHIKELSLVQTPFCQRLDQFINEDNPEIEPISRSELIIPDDDDVKQIAGLMRGFETMRNRQVEMIRSTGGKLWDKEALNPDYEKYTFEVFVRHILLNDSFHMYQMQELWTLRVPLEK